MNQEEGPLDSESPGALILDLQPPELWERNNLLFLSHPVSAILLYSNPKGLGQLVMNQSTDALYKMLELPFAGH